MKRMIASLVVLMSLAACSMPGVKSIPEFEHAYTIEQLEKAKPRIRNEQTVSWSEMRDKRSELGVRSLDEVHGMTVPNGDGTYDVLVVDYLDPESTMLTFRHEYGHVYRLAVLGVDPEDEARHEGWIGSTPYEKMIRDRRNAAKYPFRQPTRRNAIESNVRLGNPNNN